jgi:hypothetical protein
VLAPELGRSAEDLTLEEVLKKHGKASW